MLLRFAIVEKSGFLGVSMSEEEKKKKTRSVEIAKSSYRRATSERLTERGIFSVTSSIALTFNTITANR